MLTDFEHLRHIGTDPLAAIGGALVGVFDGYRAMFSGAIGDPGRIAAAIQSGNADDIVAAIRPISETLVSATPFIFVGLGLAVSFRAVLINLGVDGLFLMGGLGAALLGLLADRTSIEYVYHGIAYLPLLGVVAALLPKSQRS